MLARTEKALPRRRFLTPERKAFVKEVIGKPEVLQTALDLGLVVGGLALMNKATPASQRRLRALVRSGVRTIRPKGLAKERRRRSIARKIAAGVSSPETRRRTEERMARHLARKALKAAGRG